MDKNYGELVAALAKFQAKNIQVKKNGTVDFTDRAGNRTYYKFAQLEDIRNEIGDKLAKENLAFYQYTDTNKEDKQTYLITVLAHTSGGHVSSSMPMQLNPDPKKIGANLTYYKRYALAALLGICPEEDTDANITEVTKSEVTKPKPAKKPAAKKISPITDKQIAALHVFISKSKFTEEEFCAKIKIPTVNSLTWDKYERAVNFAKNNPMPAN